MPRYKPAANPFAYCVIYASLAEKPGKRKLKCGKFHGWRCKFSHREIIFVLKTFIYGMAQALLFRFD
jgi:hypothetical protein